MDLLTAFNAYDNDSSSQMRAIFASIFALQNRLQTIGERLQDGITMKQWLLLAMAEACPEPRTLTDVGGLMGCSRQNVKQLVSVRDLLGPSPGVCLAHSSSLLAASGSVAASRRVPLRAALCQMMPRGTRGPAEAVAPHHAKSPVVEVSPNGHAGAPDSVASAPESIVRAHRIIGSIVHLRLW